MSNYARDLLSNIYDFSIKKEKEQTKRYSLFLISLLQWSFVEKYIPNTSKICYKIHSAVRDWI